MKALLHLRVSDIARISGEPIPESDLVITRASTLQNIHENSILFVKKWTENNISAIKSAQNCLVLVPEDTSFMLPDSIKLSNVIAYVANPRLSYAKVMNAVVETISIERQYITRNGAFIADNALIGDGTVIEPGVLIDHSVVIGSSVRIHAGAVIRSFSEIGDNAIIREYAVIGSEGFGFERDRNGTPVRLPHLGGVRIGRNVEIGVSTTVCAGTIEPTIIEDDVKMGNLVHIAHNCVVGKGTLITSCVELSGSVKVGQFCWIGPNVSVIESKQIGERATIGIGAVVIKDVEPGTVVAGNPGRLTSEIRRINRAIERVTADRNE